MHPCTTQPRRVPFQAHPQHTPMPHPSCRGKRAVQLNNHDSGKIMSWWTKTNGSLSAREIASLNALAAELSPLNQDLSGHAAHAGREARRLAVVSLPLRRSERQT